MTRNPRNNEQDERSESEKRLAEKAEAVIERIIKDRPHLRSVREAMKREEEPTDEFAQEFLKAFRQRLQS